MTKHLTDTDLTVLIQEKNDELALHELISRHSGIYVDMLKKFGYNGLSFNQISDIMQDKDYVIYKAALEYKLSPLHIINVCSINSGYCTNVCSTASAVPKGFI